jgi:signal transduction histidine kinase
VRNAGGTIDLDSRPGAGSRIEVRVPLAKPGSGAASSSGPIQ